MENDWKHQTSNLPKIEKSGVISPFTAAGQAPDWRNPGKDLPFDTLEPSPGAARIGAVLIDFGSKLDRLEARNKEQAEIINKLSAEINKRDDWARQALGVLGPAQNWTRGWIAGDSAGVSQDLCQAVLAYWKQLGIEPPREPVDRTQSPDAMRYEVQQKHIAHLNLQLDGELKRHRVSVDRLREIKRIVQDV